MAGAAAGVCHAGWCSGDVASGSAGAGGRAGVSDRRTERVGPGRSTVTSRTDRVERGLARLGWIVGRNLQSEDRFAAGDERRIRAFAEEIVGRVPDVTLARGTQATEGLEQQTSTVPIVFVPVSDPVASGFVTNFARPGGRGQRHSEFRLVCYRDREELLVVLRASLLFHRSLNTIVTLHYGPRPVESIRIFENDVHLEYLAAVD